jgi:K+-sensing histidine kinase KdpD
MARSLGRSTSKVAATAAAARNALRTFAREGLPPGSVGAYVFAAACMGTAAVAHMAFAHFSPGITPSILYNSAVFVAALFAGLRAGLAATILGAALLWWGLDAGTFGLRAGSVVPALALYLFAALVIIWIAERYRAFATVHRRDSGFLQESAGRGSDCGRTSDARFTFLVRPNSLWGYAMALACIVIATVIRAELERLGGEMLPLVSYYPAVLIAALMGGLGAGLLAMVMSLAAVWWEFPGPLLSLEPITREESVGLSLYVFVSLLTVWLAENRRRAVAEDTQDATIFRLATSVLVAFAAILLGTFVLLTVDTYLAPDHLVLGYLLPTVIIAMHYGSTLAVVTAFASGVAAAYFLFPPKFSFYITEPFNVAELGFFLLLAVIASKAVGVLTSDNQARHPRGMERRAKPSREGSAPAG